MNFQRTIDAAVKLLTSSTRDSWGLADAILADIPEQQGTRHDLTSTPRDVEDGDPDLVAMLRLCNDALIEAGVTTPTGDPYDLGTLRNHRATAMQWPAVARHLEAAYRTHQEAGGREGTGRVILAGLCAVSRGEDVPTPDGVDDESWAEASAKVRSAKGRALPVTGNACRIAKSKSWKVVRQPTGATTTELLALVANMSSGVRVFAKTLAGTEAALGTTERDAIVAAIEGLIEGLNGLIAIVRGVSDADLDALLSEGRSQ